MHQQTQILTRLIELQIRERVDMKQQKSHARIHRTILELREKSKNQQLLEIDSSSSTQMKKAQNSVTATMENSEILSQSETSSVILPRNSKNQLEDRNFYKISNIISSESLNSPKQDESSYKRQIKTARPVSRRKVTSKDKYSKTACQKEEPFKIDARKSQLFQQLQILEPESFIIQNDLNDMDHCKGQILNLKAFWAKSHTFVSLFPLQYTECIIYNHPNIIPIYGQVKINDKRFVVSNEYKQSSLKDLIKQFGPFEQKLCKIYLYLILSGLQEMHCRKMAHNRLSSGSVLYDKEGQIFINVVKSTSRPLSQKQKQQKLFQYSPQILLTKAKSNSLRNDIWSIGIILLDMLFDFDILNPRYMPFHPYNSFEENITQTDAIIVDNLKQLYPNGFQIGKSGDQQNKIMSKYESLTDECKDLIHQCLRMNKDDRTSIKLLKKHAFFKK